MRYLLDTHTLIWALEDNRNLPESIKEIIIDERNDIFVSAISIWEISIKHRKNPHLLPYSGKEIVRFAQRAGYRFLSISIEDVMAIEEFDHKEHKDPFDVMLIAQSINAKMKIITHDIKLKEVSDKTALYY